MNDFDVLYKIMVSMLATDKEIPKLTLNPTSSLAMAIGKLTSVSIPADTDTNTAITMAINNFYNKLKDPIYRNDAIVLKEISDAYSTQICNAFNMLDHIKETVASMNDTIEKKIAVMSATSPVLMEYNLASSSDYKNEFQTVPWQDVENIGTKGYVFEQLKKFCTYLSTIKEVAFNMSTFNVVYNNTLEYMRSNIYNARDIIDNVEPDDTRINHTITYLADKLNLPVGDLRYYVFALFTKDGLKKVKDLSLVRADRKDITSVLDTIKDCRIFTSILNLFQEEKDIQGTLNLSHDQSIDLNVNIHLVSTLMYMNYFYINVMRENIYRDKLILGQNLINPDAYTDISSKGYTYQDISMYIYGRKVDNIPETGIYTEAVTAAVENVKSELQNQKNSLGRLASVELNNIKKHVMNSVMINKVENDNNIRTIENLELYVNSLVEDCISVEGDTIGTLYKFIINGYYKNTFIETLYNKSNTAYMAVLGNAGTATIDDKTNAEVALIADILVDHFVTNLLK